MTETPDRRLPTSIVEALTGEPDRVVEFRIRPVGKRTTQHRVSCLEPGCGDTAVAKDRLKARTAAVLHATSAHDGARARIRSGKHREQ